MKVVILAGGFGTRISEESHLKPKPMIEIDDKPILWHIMKYYSHFGYNEFIICLGYKAYVIKEFFADYYLHMSDITFDFTKRNKMIVHNNFAEPWKVTLVDTGLATMTGGRVARIRDYIGDEDFMLTYGDGVADVDLAALAAFHKEHGKTATISAIRPQGRFGMLDISEEKKITSFREKIQRDTGFINGGFMMFRPEIFNYLPEDSTILEKEPFETLAREGQLMAFLHNGFWQCMDTLRDKVYLEELIKTNKALWKVWGD
ncbi:MAG TPA: glucose-1-phosphate cytidylyltransferase [Clostridiales bacterium]|nr:glucose-1-phosphate cytidylyltransferase [Clostridiales bacterium]